MPNPGYLESEFLALSILFCFCRGVKRCSDSFIICCEHLIGQLNNFFNIFLGREIKNDGLNLVRQLALHHPQEFGAQLHTVVVAVLAEVKNLRSNVSKSAIGCLGDMFEALNVALDKVS